jgi:hypothetical protein
LGREREAEDPVNLLRPKIDKRRLRFLGKGEKMWEPYF